MYVVDDHGGALVAEYSVEADGGHLALIMESRSGSSGSRAARNPDYNQALTVLLARLGKFNAVLTDALVDSRYTQDLALDALPVKPVETSGGLIYPCGLL
jgi:hypothetical protein